MAKGRNKIKQNQRKTSPGSSVSLEQPRDDAQGSGSPRAAFSPLLSPPHLPWLFSPHHPFIQGMEKREGTGCSQKSRKAPGVGREGEGGGCILGESRSVSPRLWEQHPVGFYSLHPAAWPFPASHTRALRFSSPCSENEGKRASARAGNSVLAPQGCESSPRVVGNAGTPALELHFGVLGGNQAGK